MSSGLNIAFFGSSLVSAYWNGAATYYRGIVRALHERGHRVTFYEPDAYERQQHRDIPDPEWAKVVVYAGKGNDGVQRALEQASGADLIIKASGVGVFDELLEEAVLEIRRPNTLTVFWDVDAPATLDRVMKNPGDPFRALIPQYNMILTYGGGSPVTEAYDALGARHCIPIYNALDPATHFPVPAEERFHADLGFLGNRLPDREARVEEFFLRAAAKLPQHRFLLGGSGWADKSMPQNVNYVGHVYTKDHNAFNCTPRAVLNISRQSMAKYGFSPATRVFEAAGAGSCMITDYWEGIDMFFEPGREILVAHSGDEVAGHVQWLNPRIARNIGEAAYQRVLSQHTYAHRVQQLERTLGIKSGSSAASFSTPRETPVATNGHAQTPLKLVFLGLSLTSSWGNGHATTYRGLIRELNARGHDILFLEREAPWYAQNRDLPNPPYGRTELYSSVDELKQRFEREVRDADVVIVGSYVPDGVAIGEWVNQTARGLTAFYDIDTPITLSKLEQQDEEYISRDLVQKYRLYLSFTGGPTLDRLENEFGAPQARPLYCSVDPEMYFPEAASPQPRWHLGYLGTYSPDRQPALERLLLQPARQWKDGRMVVAGPQYPESIAWPANVERVMHLSPPLHRAFYNDQRFTLNITRAAMIQAGYAPSVRLFEAAACGTPIISDEWLGLETFFVPGDQILIARSSGDVLDILKNIDETQRRAIGGAARKRVLERHTAAHRAEELERYVVEALARA